MPASELDRRVGRVAEEVAALPGRPEVQRLLRRLSKLSRDRVPYGPRFEVIKEFGGHYGVEHHGYRFEPPLSEEQVATFEARNGIRLPEDYRAFITRVANGGAGPSYYRLLPLDPDAVYPQLHRPFPVRPDRLPNRLWDSEHGFWEFDGSPFCPELWCGTIVIADEGCTFEQLLVVTGPDRGRVVYVDLDRNGWPAFVPAPDFLTWYEDWLFHRGRATARDDEARVAVATGAAVEDAVRACFALAAPYPRTEESAIGLLGAAVRGACGPSGRARAVWALGEMANRRREVEHARRLIEPALTDPDPEVRATAVDYIVAPPETIRGFLDDPAPQVVGAALVRLVRRGEHHLDALRRMLASPSAPVRVAGAEAALRAYRETDRGRGSEVVGAEVGDLFLGVMDDPEPRVRVAAIVLLFVHRPDGAGAALLAASHDPDDEVRFRAVQALRAQRDDPAVRARLEALAGRDEVPAIRIEAQSQLPA